ncbi:MAG TPA: hypothetical protein VK530_14620, partial [Candidatus Acidoferrum sp.]|nr:hypothetical protein [Candidatus Acidoferrum sp.]
RNLLVFQISKGDTRLLELSEAEANIMAEQSALVGTDGLTRMMEVLTNAEASMRDAASRKIFIEIALIKAIDARNAVSIDAVLKRLNELRGGDAGVSAAPMAAAVARPAQVMAPSAPVVAKAAPQPARVMQAEAPARQDAGGTLAHGTLDLQALWPQLLEAIGRASPFARSYFIEAHPVSFVKNVFTIGFDAEFADHISMVDNTKNHTLISTKLAELGVPGAQVKIVKAERPDNFAAPIPPTATPEPARAAPAPVQQTTAPPVAPPKSPAPAAKPVQLDPSEFKNDPLIKKALEIFKGTIVEVRV